MGRPFRFGVSVGSAPTAEAWQEVARKAEDLGFDILLAADHIRQSFQPMLALMAAADATKTIRLGTFVINNDFRHPVLMAREAATLDFLSGGRFEFGIGAGHSGDEYAEAGIAFDRPAVRVRRMDESVQMIKRLWSEDSVSFEGEFYKITEHSSFPKPIQPSIPVAIGGNGKSVLEVAGREADIVGFTGFLPGVNGRAKAFPHFTASGLANRIEVVRAAAGERFEELELNVLVQGVDTQTGAATAEEWAKEVGFETREIVESPFVLFGSEAEIIDKLLRQRDEFGVSYITVFGPAMETIAPVVARLRGR
ncbi:MAG: TIGR03621 family F420-dependent LLM class oxidoreductase [Dehalococcoidia bacterium]